MIRSAFFRGFTVTDTEVLQAATQILDTPLAELELRRNDGAIIVRMKEINSSADKRSISNETNNLP